MSKIDNALTELKREAHSTLVTGANTMQVIDVLIETIALLSFVWLLAEFIQFTSRRGSGRKAEPAAVEPIELDEDDRPQFINHLVVPFRRRPATRPEPSDRELIELAKATDYPGAAKWSYSRKLSRPVRSKLLQLWNRLELSA